MFKGEIMTVVFVILGILAIYILICLLLIISGIRESKDIPKGTVGIVLGCPVIDNKPCNMLKQRCDRAKKYLEENPGTVCILSGGKGTDGRLSEAQAMFNYLTDKGVSPDRLIKEDNSTTTKENMIFSKRILEQYNDSDEAVIITSSFHQFRSQILAKRYGLKPYCLYSRVSPSSVVKNYLREIIVLPGLLKK